MGGNHLNIPKDPALRQRRNKSSTRATLTTTAPAGRRSAPKLPRDRAWHPRTVAWWRRVWRSPMAQQYLESDVDGLLMLADLVDRFSERPSTSLSAEIRLRGQLYGLSPIDRRRLEWVVERAEPDAATLATTLPEPPVEDPREYLRLLS